MSDEQLTRQTWRAGKKGRMRKRVKPYGGRTTAPPELLLASKPTQFPNQRKCSSLKKDGTPCGMIAYRGFTVCGAHGAQMALRRQGMLQSSGRSNGYKALIEKEQAIAPMDLMRTQTYRTASEKMRKRMGLQSIPVCV